MTHARNHDQPGTASTFAKPRGKAKKKLVRRVEPDYSQTLRRTFQLVFLAWNVYLGFLFYLWVRHCEGSASAPLVTRPAGVEGWLPIAGMMNLKYWIMTGRVPVIHPAAMFLLITFLSISFLFRKAFCSWLCPVGTLSEYLWRAGQRMFGRNFTAPRWLDIALRGLKYLLLGFFVWAVTSMSAQAIADFMGTPYGIIADVKMLNFFRHIGETGLAVLVVLAMASLFVKNFWCRYLCPYGALLGLAALFSPSRIRRNPSACIDCAKCAKACPAALPVDKLISIKSPECTACLECVAICPAKDALDMGLPRVPILSHGGRISARTLALGIAVLLFGIFCLARISGHWQTHLSDSVYRYLVPRAASASHPMPGAAGR